MPWVILYFSVRNSSSSKAAIALMMYKASRFRHLCRSLTIKKEEARIALSLLLGGDYLLSHFRSTIGVVRLNFSVRNGKRWDPHAIITLMSFPACGAGGALSHAGDGRSPRLPERRAHGEAYLPRQKNVMITETTYLYEPPWVTRAPVAMDPTHGGMAARPAGVYRISVSMH